MKSFIRNLSTPAEFCLILLFCFGRSIAYQIAALAGHRPVVLSDRQFLFSIALEIFYVAVVLWVGRIRGWSLRTFGFEVSWKWTGVGLLLYFATTYAQTLAGIATHFIHPGKAGFVVKGATAPVILLVSLINPFFEELLESGYLITTLRRFGMWVAVLSGVLLRALLHMYQGVGGVVSIIVLALFFGFTYWRWRQLWPLIVAHALNDFIGLMYWAHRPG